MHRVLAIAVFWVAAIFTPCLEGQMRAMPRPGGAVGITGGSRFRPPQRFPGPISLVNQRPVSQHPFFFRRAGFHHGLRFQVFFGNNCFADPFFCRQFFFRRRFPFAQPLFLPYPVYSAPYDYDRDAAEASANAAVRENDLANEIGRLRDEVERLRDEQKVSAQPDPRPPDEEKTVTTVLVFHDGRRDEIQNYAIAGQTLWVLTPQRARKISVADLDVKATTETNADRGVEFRLPQ
jgi:hypothetical protein